MAYNFIKQVMFSSTEFWEDLNEHNKAVSDEWNESLCEIYIKWEEYTCEWSHPTLSCLLVMLLKWILFDETYCQNGVSIGKIT